MRCAYCERLSTSGGETCNGCGAPVKAGVPAIMYDSRVFDGDAFTFKPGQNIPINTTAMGAAIDAHSREAQRRFNNNDAIAWSLYRL